MTKEKTFRNTFEKRKCLFLYYVWEDYKNRLTMKEISDLMGIPIDTLNRNIRRGRYLVKEGKTKIELI